jgi:hypothetical protein
MLDEEKNLQETRPNDRPSNGAITIVIEVENTSAANLLTVIKEVWRIAASWGRYIDENLGDWPSTEDCMKQLPIWFSSKLTAFTDSSERWLDALHDREWVWWSSFASNRYIKIDLQLGSLPASYWALTHLIEAAGGKVVYIGRWINVSEFKKSWNNGR